jgi:hypothetical protein
MVDTILAVLHKPHHDHRQKDRSAMERLVVYLEDDKGKKRVLT